MISFKRIIFSNACGSRVEGFVLKLSEIQVLDKGMNSSSDRRLSTANSSITSVQRLCFFIRKFPESLKI